MLDYGKRSLLGLRYDAVDLDAAVERITYFAERRAPYMVSALAVHGLVESCHDPRLAEALNGFDLVLPDGQPVRWALNWLHGLDLPDKVPGPSVVEQVLTGAAEDRFGVFFYGSTPDTLEGLRADIDERYSGRIEVHSCPSRFEPVDRAGLEAIATTINESGARICFVGLGCPRQERFVATVGPSLHMPALAVGAAFDFLAGTIHRSPTWMQRAGLEWAYRLAQDPSRLARRYLLTNTEFVGRLAVEAATRRFRRGGAFAADPATRLWEQVDA